jgi:hypothetical protein
MDKQTILSVLLASYPNLRENDVNTLIDKTNEIGGCSFVKINGYNSDVSKNSEIADQLINVGASYANMKNKDRDIYENFDVSKIDVNKFDYSTIDTGKLTLDEFKESVKNSLSDALAELQAGPQKKRESNDIWLNKVMCFNTNTLRLSIMGQTIKKDIYIEGEFKKVKSAPKTIAKKLIQKVANGRAASLRRFTLDNLLSSVKVSGDTIEIQ